jgi:hypothetical protein
MSNVETMAIAAIKEQVFRVEGFNLQINGKTRLVARLHKQKQTRGNMSVSEWLSENFPEVDKGVVDVLFPDGRPVRKSNQIILEAVRSRYPVDITKIAKASKKNEEKAGEINMKLKNEKKSSRQARASLKNVEEGVSQKVRNAGRNAERRAALEALDDAFQNPNAFHPRVNEIFENAIAKGLQHTQELIERILGAWSTAEKNKDELSLEVIRLKEDVRFLKSKMHP